MELLATLQRYLADPTLPVDPDWVDEMAEKHPSFTLPATLPLSRDTSGIDAPRLERIARRLTLNSPDPSALLEVVNADAARWIGIYPPEHPLPTISTEQAIDEFIATYGKPEPNETEVLERLIFNPVPADYSQVLAREQQQNPAREVKDEQSERIDRFIAAHPDAPDAAAVQQAVAAAEPPVEVQTAEAEVVDEPSAPAQELTTAGLPLQLSLAQVYISQRRYDLAFEIINTLSLKFPEKSIYFADQLRFLQKLIINQRHLDKKETK